MKAEVNVSLVPEQVAEAFWNMDAEQQAAFFAALYRLAGVSLSLQMAWVVQAISERSEAGDFNAMLGLRSLADHAEGYAESAAVWRATRAQAEADVAASLARRNV